MGKRNREEKLTHLGNPESGGGTAGWDTLGTQEESRRNRLKKREEYNTGWERPENREGSNGRESPEAAEREQTGWGNPETLEEEDSQEEGWEGWDTPQRGFEDPDKHNRKTTKNNINTRRWKTPQKKPASIRARNIIVSVLLALVVLISAGAIGFLILQISGKNNLYSRADSTRLVSTLSEMAVELEGEGIQEEPIQEEGKDNWQEGDIRYEGLHYRYNADILTFLFMGIDKMEEVKEKADGIDGGQADAIFLLALDPHQKKATVIGIPRDTMTEVEMRSSRGTYLGRRELQIALQHAYGDGAAVSCERTMEAVSNLLYGLPIHGYCAINMGAIPLLNDAVGGIDLEALETLDFKEIKVKEGEPLHLEGMVAYYYIHHRDTKKAGSAGGRLERQKQYLEAYAGKAIEKIKADVTFPVGLYNTLSKYMVTDIGVDEVGYLATQVPGYSFGAGDIRSLEGTTSMGERYEEFRVDEEALYRLIVDVFYEEVP